MSATVHYSSPPLSKRRYLPVSFPEAFLQSCEQYFGWNEPSLTRDDLHTLYNLADIDINVQAWNKIIHELRTHEEVEIYVSY